MPRHPFSAEEKEAVKKRLGIERYRIIFEGGTEPPGTGVYEHTHDPGVYHCASCNQPLFSSESKFDSGTGWPSFDRPISPDAVELAEDRSFGMIRTETVCSNCGAHLGHVFDDGPTDTGKRYCMNSAALELEKS